MKHQSFKREVSPQTRKILIILVCLLFITPLTLFYIYKIHDLSEKPLSTDFYKFYYSSHLALQDQNPYQRARLPGHEHKLCDSSSSHDSVFLKYPEDFAVKIREPHDYCLHPNLNPPLFIALTKPLAKLDFNTAWWVWSLASIFSGILALILIFRNLSHTKKSGALIALSTGMVFFSYFPTFTAIRLGQTTLFIFLLVSLGWISLRKDKKWPAGIWFGLATSLKPFVGLFLPLLILLRDWKTVKAFSLSLVISFFLGSYMIGIHTNFDYIAALDSITWYAASWNASFVGFFTRLFGGSENVPWINAPLLAKCLAIICSLAVFSAIAYIARRLAHHDHKKQADALVSLTITAMLLISPLGWMYYFPLLLITLLTVWKYGETSNRETTLRLALISAICITGIPSVLIPAEEMNTHLNLIRDAGPYFISLLLLFCASVYTAVSQLNFKSKQ